MINLTFSFYFSLLLQDKTSRTMKTEQSYMNIGKILRKGFVMFGKKIKDEI